MSLIRCPECGKEISDTAASCPNCGYSFQKMKFCKFCGEKIPEDSVICTKCGRQVENQTEYKGVTINNVALVLCIFLGWCGAHKFYERKTGMGLLYIFTIGLFGIGWIVDIITIATKPNPYYV